MSNSLENLRKGVVEHVKPLQNLDLQVFFEFCIVLQSWPVQQLANLRIVESPHPCSEYLRLNYFSLQI